MRSRPIICLLALTWHVGAMSCPAMAEPAPLEDMRVSSGVWLAPAAPPATPSIRAIDWRPGALGVLGAAGWGLAALPGLTGAGQIPTVTTFVLGSVAAYVLEGEWMRAIATPLGDVLAGTAGYFLASSVVLPLLSGRSYSTGSALGAQWAETGALIGVGAFHVLVGWDAFRIANQQAKAKQQAP